jgi:hypothetical protein
MALYYVNTNAQANGDHEVHKDGCDHMPSLVNREYLGVYDNCQDAVDKAKEKYSTADGCKFCCPKCHTR